MFDNKQLEVLRECLDNKYGENLINIRDLGNCKLSNIQGIVEKARIENETINQIKGILRTNYGTH